MPHLGLNLSYLALRHVINKIIPNQQNQSQYFLQMFTFFGHLSLNKTEHILNSSSIVSFYVQKLYFQYFFFILFI